jgi:hypothetical protein
MSEHVEGLPRQSDLCSTGAIEQGDNTQVTSPEHRLESNQQAARTYRLEPIAG